MNQYRWLVSVTLLGAAASGCGTTKALTSDANQGSSDGPAVDSATIDSGIVADATQPPAVDVVLTADNAYSFGWGSESAVSNYRTVAPATVENSSNIFGCPIGLGPEAYVVPGDEAPDGAYLYVISWGDFIATQGVIGQFLREGDSTPLYTGVDPTWQVCATGLNYADFDCGQTDSSCPNNGWIGPTQDIVNAQLTICNAGTGDPSTTSRGWVSATGPDSSTPSATGVLAVGEDNSDAGGDFPIVCQMNPPLADGGVGQRGVDAAAKWMWYLPAGVTGDAFRHSGSGNTFETFLIFRLPAQSIPIQ